MQFLTLYPFLLSMLIGALIGTERQRRLAQERIRGVAGLRTFTLIAMLGTLSSKLAETYGPFFALAALASFVVLIGISYSASVSAQHRLDLTGAVAAVITFALGLLCGIEESSLLAVALGIITTWVLATKAITHRYVEALTEADLLDTLKMGLMALVIYPLLPEETIDPLGVLSLRKIWLMVVLVSLIGYVGYILIRILGTRRGLSLTGVFGGLVSSTAVTMAMASEVRAQREICATAVFAAAIASCTMFPRMLFIVLVVNRELFLDLLPSLSAMTILGVGLAFLLLREKGEGGKDIGLDDPFRIVPALKFGAFFAFILLISKIATIHFGDAGTYAASIISGLADVDAITLSLATLAHSGLSPDVAVKAIIMAAITNTLVKLTIAYILGSREFGGRMAMILLPTAAVGILVALAF
ncbi:MAG: MgtC/SapB family protein [Methanotrichaceae archaeon]|nr:MgtC/SapB family protein [Methanotrichaceae archaeon]